MAPIRIRPSCVRVAVVLVPLLLEGPSIIWAHGEPVPDQSMPGPAFLWTLLLLALPTVIGFTLRLCCRPGRRSPCHPVGHSVAWTLIGLLGLYLTVLPPHLVHHLAGPREEGTQCTLFVEGNISEQERAEAVVLVGAPSPGGTMANCPAPPARFQLIPTPSGRSSPALCS